MCFRPFLPRVFVDRCHWMWRSSPADLNSPSSQTNSGVFQCVLPSFKQRPGRARRCESRHPRRRGLGCGRRRGGHSRHPELFPTGYAPARIHHLDGAPVRQAVSKLAESYGIAVVASTVEQSGSGRFITATLFGSDGTPVLHYRKSHLFGPEEAQFFAAGTELSPAFGSAISQSRWGCCYDVEFPEYVRASPSQGPTWCSCPTAVPTRVSSDIRLRRRAKPARAGARTREHGGDRVRQSVRHRVRRPQLHRRAGRIPCGAGRDEAKLIFADITSEAIRAAERTIRTCGRADSTCTDEKHLPNRTTLKE